MFGFRPLIRLGPAASNSCIGPAEHGHLRPKSTTFLVPHKYLCCLCFLCCRSWHYHYFMHEKARNLRNVRDSLWLTPLQRPPSPDGFRATSTPTTAPSQACTCNSAFEPTLRSGFRLHHFKNVCHAGVLIPRIRFPTEVATISPRHLRVDGSPYQSDLSSRLRIRRRSCARTLNYASLSSCRGSVRLTTGAVDGPGVPFWPHVSGFPRILLEKKANVAFAAR